MWHATAGGLRLLGCVAGAVLWLLTVQGCALSGGYYPVLEQQLARHDYAAADVTVSKHAAEVVEALGLCEEFAAYRQHFPQVQYDSLPALRSKGELIYLSYHGLAPLKHSAIVDIPVPGSNQRPIHLVQLAFPTFVPRPSSIAHAQLSASGLGTRASAQTYLVQDITAIAGKDLQDRLGRISAKTLARAAAKYAAARGLEEGVRRGTSSDAAGAIVGVLANVAGVATEQADTRSWRLLPGAFHLARLPVPPGTYKVAVTYYATRGGVLEERTLADVPLAAGAKVFLSYHLLW